MCTHENCHLDTFDFQTPEFDKKSGCKKSKEIIHEKIIKNEVN